MVQQTCSICSTSMVKRQGVRTHRPDMVFTLIQFEEDRYPDGPITARYRFIKNAFWVRWYNRRVQIIAQVW